MLGLIAEAVLLYSPYMLIRIDPLMEVIGESSVVDPQVAAMKALGDGSIAGRLK